jgi:ribosomal protein S18 acetylase RimI-like enzyme
MIEVKICKSLSESQLVQLSDLMNQLCPECPPLSASHLQNILADNHTLFHCAFKEQVIIGSLTFTYYHIPTGTRAWIEDVVVDKNFRGQKIGETLVLHVIEEAKKLGITQIDLTSRPERKEANKLYQKLGFQQRQTNAYRLMIK